ncbi:MAG TPA: alpha-amylase family glycosyl hydrolase [Anaerolineaceae bacterium]|nr:alpha-amylase family glycosyl hydrolase [Anaerolineaceae bacterium]
MRSFKFTLPGILMALILTACQVVSTAAPTLGSVPSSSPELPAEVSQIPTETPDPAIPTPGLLASMATKAAVTAQAAQQTEQASGPVATIQSVETPNTGWWNNSTFYEIFVRSFKDSNGDGIGDFKGITSQLDYLNDGDPNNHADLGITGIWLMPIMPSPSYHGYDVIDYMNVNPQYGTMADFKELVQECHKRGIRVIIDFVVNHTSSQNPWFNEAVAGNKGFENWYIWSDSRPQESGPWGQGVWHEARNGRYYYGLFTADMPDLNYRNPIVTQMMDMVTKYWLEEVEVDGFRVDAARYLFEDGVSKQDTKETIVWFQNWRNFLKPLNPEAFTVGEVWADTFTQKKYVSPRGLDSLFAFDLAEDIKGAIYSPDPSRIIKGYQDAISTMPDYSFSTFLSNHDQERVSDLYGGDDGKSKQAAFVYLTGPGIPFVYYGEEIGMLGAKPDPNIRTPMQWTGDKLTGFTTGSPWKEINADAPERNVALQSTDPDSLLSWYRELIAIRNEHPVLATSPYLSFTSNCTTIYATLRSDDTETLLTLLNIGGKEQNNCEISIEKSPLAGEYTATNLWGKSTIQTISFGTDGSLKEYLVAPQLAGGESIILKLGK